MSGMACRCRNLADEHMPPSARIGDTEAKRRGLWSTVGCPLHSECTCSPTDYCAVHDGPGHFL